ncbi:MAG: putative ribonucleotide transport ATP-binding protein mkl [Chlamydiae bacterium]|nr:putative ribonucleotide transport ATP-binding protein mkl [Chlamydiota bacterium]
MTEERKLKIKVRDLWKRYGSLQVLTGLDLDVYEGETLVILGRSGVGKSVLLKQIMGIEIPEKGSIEFNDKDLLTLSRRERLKEYMHMGMLFQGSALFDSMNVEENTSFYLNQHGDPRKDGAITKEEIRERAIEALRMVDLEGTEKKMPSDLSGGMRKRAGLARLIVYRPSVMLFDEPTTGLDPITAMQINKLIKKTQHELKATSIVVTHDIRSATEVGDRLALHHDGKIRHIATKEEFFEIDDPVIQTFIQNAEISKSMIGG